ncbi:flagellar filament capping protein FliD [Treponema sp.]|uniref:flagellar filament capping protein FliD n=1 Tax=Treponema sp. TaxID=166 RepID=UPI00298DDE70|nr:flagellar filament capping protein FliD [Treponema sp.]MCQ2242161.1 flagellar filament capping protein FliD [Treponema sp.]
MADGLNIPGVSDKYKTNDLVKALMDVERVPLKREEEKVETFKNQQEAWRGMNQKMSTLRDSCKTLYSFENPFNNKLTTSSDEAAVTVDAGREAEYGSFKLEVIQPAATDRFLSADIDSDYNVKEGQYTFQVGEKTVDFKWKGGKLGDFVNALNKRGGETVKASLIGVSAERKSLLIESLKTGEENRLVFKNKALDFAKEIDMIGEAKAEKKSFVISQDKLYTPEKKVEFSQTGLPEISRDRVSSKGSEITVGPRGGFEIDIPADEKSSKTGKVEFTFKEKNTKDITPQPGKVAVAEAMDFLDLPSPGMIEYEGITVYNNISESTLPPPQETEREAAPSETAPAPSPVVSNKYFFIRDSKGNETPLSDKSIKAGKSGKTTVSIPLKEYPDAKTLVVRNANTGKEITMSAPVIYSDSNATGIKPKHAISTAQDATIKYEGITMTRASNDIDDVVPHLTLHIHDKTDRPATIKVDPDTESAKDAIITFVGKYNQAIAEMNVLSQNKPELISELDYLSSDEQDKMKERLGMFQGEMSLTSGKSQMQQIVAGTYKYDANSTITLLAQLGVSTNASGNAGGGYRPSQMRGYLEVDEKKLDAALAENINQIKNLFGYDSDGDLIVDNGIGYRLDKQLTSWVQSGGIISTKTNSLESQIKSSNQKITRLQTQLDRKEAELKRKYAQMEGSLGSLESQQNSLQNFANQNQKK